MRGGCTDSQVNHTRVSEAFQKSFSRLYRKGFMGGFRSALRRYKAYQGLPAQFRGFQKDFRKSLGCFRGSCRLWSEQRVHFVGGGGF